LGKGTNKGFIGDARIPVIEVMSKHEGGITQDGIIARLDGNPFFGSRKKVSQVLAVLSTEERVVFKGNGEERLFFLAGKK